MRWLNLTILGLALAGSARGEDIVDVLRRSQQMRLDSMAIAPESQRTQTVRNTFENLRQTLAPDVKVELRVIAAGTYAETLNGEVVVANEALADLPEGERMFILAHEIGHVVEHHWLQLNQLYKRWVPGEVTPQQTDPVAVPLGREASGLAHRHEYAADAFALRALRDLGWEPQHAYSAFLRQGMQHDTATHPGTRKRVASLRAAQAGVSLNTGENAE
jgi:Zn-dependent protease with chaperone function